MMTLVYIPCKDEQEAVKLSKHLIKRRLVACANIHPIRSVYRWEAKIVDEDESVIIAKTLPKNFGKIKEEITKLHSYDIPCILRIDAEANDAYEKWIHNEVE